MTTRQLWTLLDVACPLCGAAIDEKCRRRPTGQVIPEFHVARRVAFKRVAEPFVRPVR